jgi:VCBS repeat-containing protein
VAAAIAILGDLRPSAFAWLHFRHDGKSSATGCAGLFAIPGSGPAAIRIALAQIGGASQSNMQINVVYDQSVSSLPAGFVAAVNYVVNDFDNLFTNPVTVNIDLGYGEIGGQALAAGALGESETYLESASYSTVLNALNANAPGASQQAAYATLPATSPLSGGTLWLSTAQEKALGLRSGTDSSIDGYVGLSSTDPFSYSPTATPASNQYDLIGVIEHEFSEVMGRTSFLGDAIGGTASYAVMDLFRYAAAGVRQLGTGGPAYFSINGGSTNLDSWNTDPNGDLGDWASSAGADAFLAFSPSGQIDRVTASDLTLMNVLGWDTQTHAIAVSATGTDALQGGSPVPLLEAAPSITDTTSNTVVSAAIKIANAGGGPVAGDELLVNGQQIGTVDGGAVTVSWNNTTKTLTLAGRAPVADYQALLGAVTYQDAGTDTSIGSHPQRSVTWSVNDGTASFSATSQVTIDRPPTAIADSGAAFVGPTLTVSAAGGVLSNDTDPDKDILTVAGVSDVGHGSGGVGQPLAGVYGHLTLNADGSYAYAADIASAINTAPTGVHLQDSFSYVASDGNSGTASAQLNITLYRLHVSASNVQLRNGQTSVPASSLFTASDLDGDAITRYAIFDATLGGGHFQVGNAVEPSGSAGFYITAAQLAQTTFIPGPGGTSDHIYVGAFAGSLESPISSFYVGAPVDTPPVVTASNVQLTNGQTSIAASSLFTASDPDGDAITQYAIFDATSGNGHFQVGNTVEPSGSAGFYITAAQLAQTTFIPGPRDTSDHIYVGAFDGAQEGPVVDFYVHAPIDTPPIVTASNVQLTKGQTSVAASSLFTANDPDGDAITQYAIFDATSGSGYFQVGNAVEPSGSSGFYITAAQLAQTTFMPGPRGSSDHIYVGAFDGAQEGPAVSFDVRAPVDTAPVVTASNVQLTSGQTSVAASSLFTASDSDGDAITQYAIFDATSGSGYFQVGNAVEPSGSAGFYITAVQLAQTTFIPGPNGSTDHIYVGAFDGAQEGPVVDFSVSAPIAAPAIQVIETSVLFPADREVGSGGQDPAAPTKPAPGIELLGQYMASAFAPSDMSGDDGAAIALRANPVNQAALLAGPGIHQPGT